jgi:hypothetical protein
MAKENFSFSNDDILGGLKAAIERGEALKDAMMSFYNAGYAKEDIEEAARRYIMESTEEDLISSTKKENLFKAEQEKKQEAKKPATEEISFVQSKEKENIISKKINPEPSRGFFGLFKSKKPTKISDYGLEPQKKKKKFEKMTVMLVSLLLFLILILGVVLLFKQELIDLFNKWLG